MAREAVRNTQQEGWRVIEGPFVRVDRPATELATVANGVGTAPVQADQSLTTLE